MGVSKPIILDSNIVIYSGLTSHYELKEWLKSKVIAVSLITKLEVLGYHSLNEKDEIYFESFFKKCELIAIDSLIIKTAISLRQLKSMSLADAIIAATTKHYNLPLITANNKDFKHIEDLEIINPLSF
jgi:predicted nucleic acid-binding protein